MKMNKTEIKELEEKEQVEKFFKTKVGQEWYERLGIVEQHVKAQKITVMIIGLGSVGTYLLDYLVSRNDESLRIVVVGRNRDKMQQNVNIVRVAALIRGLNKTVIEIQDGVDLTDVDAVRKAIETHQPDFIVNSSRAYPGLKYGSISSRTFLSIAVVALLSKYIIFASLLLCNV